MIFNNELIIQILSFVTPIVSLIGWAVSQKNNIFNTKKIQKYDVWDYQYTVFLFQAFYSIINPMIFLVGFFFANWVSIKIEIINYLQLIFFIEIYFAIIIIVLVVESEIISKRKEKLKIISSYT